MNGPTTHNEWLTTTEAAELLCISPKTLNTWRSTGRYAIPHLKIGSKVRYRKSDLIAWLDGRLANGSAILGRPGKQSIAEHTPGPWHTGQSTGSDCRIYAPTENHAIARTYGPELNGIGVCALTGPKNKADARLIAAAPELLAALEALIGTLDNSRIQEGRRDKALDAARAAIAKARTPHTEEPSHA